MQPQQERCVSLLPAITEMGTAGCITASSARQEEIQAFIRGKAWLWVLSANAHAATPLGRLLSLCGVHSNTLPHLHSKLWADSWLAVSELVLRCYAGACTCQAFQGGTPPCSGSGTPAAAEHRRLSCGTQGWSADRPRLPASQPCAYVPQGPTLRGPSMRLRTGGAVKVGMMGHFGAISTGYASESKLASLQVSNEHD